MANFVGLLGIPPAGWAMIIEPGSVVPGSFVISSGCVIPTEAQTPSAPWTSACPPWLAAKMMQGAETFHHAAFFGSLRAMNCAGSGEFPTYLALGVRHADGSARTLGLQRLNEASSWVLNIENIVWPSHPADIEDAEKTAQFIDEVETILNRFIARFEAANAIYYLNNREEDLALRDTTLTALSEIWREVSKRYGDKFREILEKACDIPLYASYLSMYKSYAVEELEVIVEKLKALDAPEVSVQKNLPRKDGKSGESFITLAEAQKAVASFCKDLFEIDIEDPKYGVILDLAGSNKDLPADGMVLPGIFGAKAVIARLDPDRITIEGLALMLHLAGHLMHYILGEWYFSMHGNYVFSTSYPEDISETIADFMASFAHRAVWRNNYLPDKFSDAPDAPECLALPHGMTLTDFRPLLDLGGALTDRQKLGKGLGIDGTSAKALLAKLVPTEAIKLAFYGSLSVRVEDMEKLIDKGDYPAFLEKLRVFFRSQLEILRNIERGRSQGMVFSGDILFKIINAETVVRTFVEAIKDNKWFKDALFVSDPAFGIELHFVKEKKMPAYGELAENARLSVMAEVAGGTRFNDQAGFISWAKAKYDAISEEVAQNVASAFIAYDDQPQNLPAFIEELRRISKMIEVAIAELDEIGRGLKVVSVGGKHGKIARDVRQKIHDFRNRPGTVVIAWVSMIRSGNEGIKDWERYGEMILSAILPAKNVRFIERILQGDLKRLVDGKNKDVKGAVKMRFTYDGSGLDKAYDTGDFVLEKGCLLNRAINNAITNAVKFGAENVEVKLKFQDGELLFEVTNDGLAMSRTGVFQFGDAYWRSDGAIAEGVRGTGIGAGSMMDCVAKLGGTFDISSTKGGVTVNAKMAVEEDTPKMQLVSEKKVESKDKVTVQISVPIANLQPPSIDENELLKRLSMLYRGSRFKDMEGGLALFVLAVQSKIENRTKPSPFWIYLKNDSGRDRVAVVTRLGNGKKLLELWENADMVAENISAYAKPLIEGAQYDLIAIKEMENGHFEVVNKMSEVGTVLVGQMADVEAAKQFKDELKKAGWLVKVSAYPGMVEAVRFEIKEVESKTIDWSKEPGVVRDTVPSAPVEFMDLADVGGDGGGDGNGDGEEPGFVEEPEGGHPTSVKVKAPATEVDMPQAPTLEFSRTGSSGPKKE